MIQLSNTDIYKLGVAAGSFSVGDIDQGIHIVLPVTTLEGVPENEVFTPLFTGYFDPIPKEMLKDDVIGLVYMGAVEKFLDDNGIHVPQYHRREFTDALSK